LAASNVFSPAIFTTGERKIFGSWKSRPASLINQTLLHVKAFFKDQVDVVKNEADSSVELSINLRSRGLAGSNPPVKTIKPLRSRIP
jgi:hypothetical protein